MSETAAPLPARRLVLPFSLELRLTWETVAFAALAVVGGAMRFWDLGSRALHHDESLHGFYAYDQIYRGLSFEHSPLLHGPFQFFGTALTFFLTGGASDYTVRVFPALFGVALVLLPYFFRHRLGRVGALATAALIAFSPTLLYFSRFARNDIYIAVFTLGIVIALWRYADTRRPLFLYLGAGLLGPSFATKENTFINVALLLSFLELWLAAEFTRDSRQRLGLGRLATATVYLFLYLPWAWAIVALWPFARGFRERLGLSERPAAADFLLVVGTLSLPQFAAAVQVPLDALGYPLDTLDREQAVGIPLVVGLLIATAAVGLRWNWRVWSIAAAAFYIPYGLLYTSFLTNFDGFGTGIWDSLDYWLDQHSVRRGNQPDFYYVMLLPAYEYLALAFAGPALLYFTLRGGPRSWLLTAVTVVSLLAFFGADSVSATAGDIVKAPALIVAAVGVWFAVRGTAFERFLVFWAGAAIVAYSWAGEKMPWLSVHTTLPIVLLAGYALGRVWGELPRAAGLLRYAPALLPFAAAALGAATVSVTVFGPVSDGLRIALIALSSALLVALLPPPGRRRVTVVLAGAVFGALALFSVRTAVLASFEHGDVPREVLIYTQTSPEVPDVMERIEEVGHVSGLGRDLRVVVDTEFTWPWAWYLRDYNVQYNGIAEDFEPSEGAVLLIAEENQDRIEPYLDRYQEPVPFRLRWWFPETYRDIGRDSLLTAISDFGKSLTRSSTWENWWHYFRDREPPGALGSRGSILYVPEAYNPEAGADFEGRLTIGRLGDATGTFNNPTGVAADGEGNIYVVDLGNARLQKFGPDGKLLKSIGGQGVKKGKFNQPWDVTVDGKGNVYVIDTWNHRVQKFDSDLKFVKAWGKPTDDLVNPGPLQMWGPRSIAIGPEGNVWVVDTGTHTVREFSPDGKPLSMTSEWGRSPGQLREPVGITFDPLTGDMLVADTGNARIQRFDRKTKEATVYRIKQWSEVEAVNRPDLAALPDGRFLATDPVHNRVLLLTRDGRVEASLDTVVDEPLVYPRGIAYQEDGGFVLISEGLAHQVRRFPLTDFALQ